MLNLNSKNLVCSISKSIKCPYITQLKYCQKLDFEADPSIAKKFDPINKF